MRALLITDNKVYRALLRKSMFVKQNIDFSFLGLIVFLSIFYSSCNTARYLHSDESLLKGTKIVYKNEKNVSDKSSLTNEILQLIDYKPNGKLLFLIPEEWLYLSNIRSGKDSSWYNKAFSKLGAPPVLYDEGKHKIIASNIENYLRFRKGYYEARVDFITKEKIVGWTSSKGSVTRFDTEVSYIVSTGDRYRINSITYESEDKSLLRFIQSVNDETLIRKNDYIDFLVIEEEKKRLVLELQNNGYAGFAGNYIELNGDSSRINKTIDLTILIRTPLPAREHKRYITGNVRVFTDYIQDQSDSIYHEQYTDKSYYRQSDDFLVKPSVLSNMIFLKQNEYLSRTDRQKTFRKLNGIGTYRFVTFNNYPDSEKDTVMNFDIQLSPHQKKWVFDGGFNGYYSTLGPAELIGFGLSSQLVNRNLLGGSERYTMRAETGWEFGFSQESGITRRTTNFSFQNNLVIPSFQDFIGLGKLVNRFGLIKDRFYNDFREDAVTNIDLGFSNVNIINLYSLQSLNASFGFDYTSARNNRYVFRPLGFNLDQYEIKDTASFELNPLILLSFKDILRTGFLFRDFSYVYNRPKDKKGRSFLVINNLELSGSEVYLANKLYNTISGTKNIWALADQISFAKYVRYEFDGRYNKEYSRTSSFAARLNAGIIIPFGDNKVAPFIRQFGVGGPNSLRAWNIKEPGPGGYRDPQTKVKDTPGIFVNQGDIRLEMNAEYRFKIFLVMDGALFVDAGNVWVLKDDATRPNASISTSFYKQIALGAGYGVRLNFDFFIIRFDFGYKLRSPFTDDYKKSQWYSFKEIRQQGLGNVQVGVNYPF